VSLTGFERLSTNIVVMQLLYPRMLVMKDESSFKTFQPHDRDRGQRTINQWQFYFLPFSKIILYNIYLLRPLAAKQYIVMSSVTNDIYSRQYACYASDAGAERSLSLSSMPRWLKAAIAATVAKSFSSVRLHCAGEGRARR
jgi:hypothetical protein